MHEKYKYTKIGTSQHFSILGKLPFQINIPSNISNSQVLFKVKIALTSFYTQNLY